MPVSSFIHLFSVLREYTEDEKGIGLTWSWGKPGNPRIKILYFSRVKEDMWNRVILPEVRQVIKANEYEIVKIRQNIPDSSVLVVIRGD